jgi:hypothetical protein
VGVPTRTQLTGLLVLLAVLILLAFVRACGTARPF